MAASVSFNLDDIFASLSHIKDGIPTAKLSTRRLPGVHKSVSFGPSTITVDVQEYDEERDSPEQIIHSMYDPDEDIIWARKTREEHGLVVTFFADLSDSVINAGTDFIKRRMLLEAIGFIGLSGARYIDRTAVIGFTDRVVLKVPARGGVLSCLHLLKILYDCLQQQETSVRKREPRKTDLFAVFSFMSKNLDRQCYVPVISDFIELEEAMRSQRFVRLLSHVARKHEVLFIFLDDPSEVTRVAGRGYVREEDIETGKQIVTSRSQKERQRIVQNERAARTFLRKECLAPLGIDSVVLEPGKQVQRLHKFFLKRRASRHRILPH